MNLYHYAYVSTPPDSARNRFEHLFLLLDEMNPIDRNELLEHIYLTCDISFEQTGTPQEVAAARYKEFVNHCFRVTFFPVAVSHQTRRIEEEVQVFAIMCYLLASAYWKAHVSALEGFISSHRDMIQFWRQELRREELPASEVIDQIKSIAEKIEGLHQEVEVRRRAYGYVCDHVVKKLLREFDDGYAPGFDVGSIVNSRCFRATQWEWLPIRKLIVELASDLFEQEEIKQIIQMGEHRLEGAAKCRDMAARFRNWLDEHEGGYSLDPPDRDGREWRVERERLSEWIEFLEECDGYRPTIERIKSSLESAD